jgi:hypothetical protein
LLLQSGLLFRIAGIFQPLELTYLYLTAQKMSNVLQPLWLCASEHFLWAVIHRVYTEPVDLSGLC